MRTRDILASIRKVEILSDQKASVLLRGIPHNPVVATGDSLVQNCVNVMPKVGESVDETMR
jgi:hypothetical protein